MQSPLGGQVSSHLPLEQSVVQGLALHATAQPPAEQLHMLPEHDTGGRDIPAPGSGTAGPPLGEPPSGDTESPPASLEPEPPMVLLDPPHAAIEMSQKTQQAMGIRKTRTSIPISARMRRGGYKSGPQVAGPQRDGDPVHTPAQQSPAELQSAPLLRQAAVHTDTPCAFAMHRPRQQSPSTVQGVPGSRQAPGPRSQRFVPWLQTPEQQVMPASPPVQPSPDARQTVLESIAHTPLLHDDEQQSSSAAQLPPAMTQMGAPHTFPWQPSEQQSCATSQCEPSTAQ